VANLSGAAPALWWALIGATLAGVHLWMLWHALARADPLDPARAGTRVATTMPLRLLALAPVLVMAARTGLWACVGLVAGSLVGRWLLVRYLRDRWSLPIRCHKQG
jgi:hypothetical protein